jgi:hypothetical protein
LLHNLLLFHDAIHGAAGTGGQLIACNIDHPIRTVSLRVDFECSGRYSVQAILSTVLEIKIILFLLNNEKEKKKDTNQKQEMGARAKIDIPTRVS